MPKTKFLKLSEVFEQLEKTASNLAMIDVLANFFPKISPEEARISAYLLRGELAPAYENIEIGIADKMAMRVIAKSKNIEIKKIKLLLDRVGDLGLVVEKLYNNQNHKSGDLNIEEVFEKLVEISKIGGEGSQEEKVNFLVHLLLKASGLEAKYIIRTILGTLRLGVGEMTFLQGLAKAFGAGKKDKEILEYAFNVLSDLGEVAYIVSDKSNDFHEGKKELREDKIKEIFTNIKPRVGVPIRMMSANRVEDLGAVKDHIKGEVVVEEKYDGERVQAHIKKDGEIVLFSRRQEKITHQYPDIVDGLKESFIGGEAIIEGEVLAYDRIKEKFLPFQILMSRRRKYDIEECVKKIPAKYLLFDLLYLGGESYLKKPLKERRKALERVFKKNNLIDFSKYAITSDLSEIKIRFLNSLKKGNEGIMVKDCSGIYRAGSRGWLWIKFKKEYQKELADNFDLVVVGGIYGAGRRAKTYGSLLVAAYDQNKNKYYSFTKVGTGFTDESLSQLIKMLDKYKLKEKHKLVETGMKLDVWFEPKIVMEISGAEITVSPIHTVAKNEIKTGGLALRFPKFLRWRTDKSPENSTSVKEIRQIYELSKKK